MSAAQSVCVIKMYPKQSISVLRSDLIALDLKTRFLCSSVFLFSLSDFSYWLRVAD